MKKLLVIDVVGLTPSFIGPHTPRIRDLAAGGFQAELAPVLPAVTCTAQSTMLTGRLPREHGIVANGWYFRDLAEVWFWRQSDGLVAGEKVWDRCRRRIQRGIQDRHFCLDAGDELRHGAFFFCRPESGRTKT